VPRASSASIVARSPCSLAPLEPLRLALHEHIPPAAIVAHRKMDGDSTENRGTQMDRFFSAISWPKRPDLGVPSWNSIRADYFCTHRVVRPFTWISALPRKYSRLLAEAVYSTLYLRMTLEKQQSIRTNEKGPGRGPSFILVAGAWFALLRQPKSDCAWNSADCPTGKLPGRRSAHIANCYTYRCRPSLFSSPKATNANAVYEL